MFPFRRGGNNTRLYGVLELEPESSPDEIKRAYRRLALQYHPDKNPNAGDQFKEISDAYSVLSDPTKKDIYDKYGEEGLSFINNGFLGEDGGELLPLLMQPHLIGLVYLLVLVLVCMVVLVPIFLVVKIDNAVTWSWAATFSPIYILLGFLLAYNILVPLFITQRKFKMIYSGVQTLLIILFFAFLAARLDGSIGWMFYLVFIPLYVHELFSLIRRIPASTVASYRTEATQRDSDGGSPRSFLGLGYMGFLLRQYLWGLLRVWFLIFLVVRIDRVVTWSWWVTFVPVLVWFVLLFVLKKLDDRVMLNAIDVDETERRDSTRGYLTFMTVLLAIAIVIAMIFLGLLLAKIDNTQTWSLAKVFIPVFIVLGILLCCCCCCVPCIYCCCMKNAVSEEADNPFYTGRFAVPRHKLLTDSPNPTTPLATNIASSSGPSRQPSTDPNDLKEL
eukprot:TRINITY_DN6297_c0_g1_i3.p1 TRINITY_DN6297_c0_g1~~TRINITY_DN6297_c0_g1_i3.p1  ORF type:complete len:446 (-),score=54.82 TRINITY_DN6297_c0_g1_i3:36-1373(-)